MTDSLRKQIRDAAVAVFDAMAPSGGYNLDWAANGGAQPPRNRNDVETLPAVFVWIVEETKEPEDNSGVTCDLVVECRGLVDWDQEDEDFDICGAADDGAYDVERALLLEAAKTPPFGITGVRKVDVLSTAILLGEGGLAFITRANVRYRHSLSDPGVGV